MESVSTFNHSLNDKLCCICLVNQAKYGLKCNNHDLLCLPCTLHFIRIDSEFSICPLCRFKPFDRHTLYNIHQRYLDIFELQRDIIYQFYCLIYPILETKDKLIFTVKDPECPYKRPVFDIKLDDIYNKSQRGYVSESIEIIIIYADIQNNPRQVNKKESRQKAFNGKIDKIYESYKPLLQATDSTLNIKNELYQLYEKIKDDITLQNTIKYKILKMHYLINYLEPEDSFFRISFPYNELYKLTDEQMFRQLQINDILYTNADKYGLYMNFVKYD